MNLLSVDAFVFPTLRRAPALIGEPQRGSSCSLSANTGLPSISVPVGFTNQGLPIGMEMIGRTLDDARLVAFAYAFEAGTDHRRTPWSTPPLVDGRPIRAMVVDAEVGEAATGEIAVEVGGTYRPLIAQLALTVRLLGDGSSEALAAAVQVPEGEDGWMVIATLPLQGRTSASTEFRLTEGQRAALLDGRARLAVLTPDRPLGAAVIPLSVRQR